MPLLLRLGEKTILSAREAVGIGKITNTDLPRLRLTGQAICIYSVYRHAQRHRHFAIRSPTDVPADHGAGEAESSGGGVGAGG